MNLVLLYVHCSRDVPCILTFTLQVQLREAFSASAYLRKDVNIKGPINLSAPTRDNFNLTTQPPSIF